MERTTHMDVADITEPIQAHSTSNVYPAENTVSPTIEMLKLIAPPSADAVLDFIGDHARAIKAASDLYQARASLAAFVEPSTDTAGLITAHTHSRYHSSYPTPASLSGDTAGEGAGVNFSSAASDEKVPSGGPQSTELSIRISVLV